MHLISMKALRDFWSVHPAAERPLRAWAKIARDADWRNFADVRAIHASADTVGDYVVFNIGGNKFRLIAAIHYDRGRVYIRHVLTHKEYDQGGWKDG